MTLINHAVVSPTINHELSEEFFHVPMVEVPYKDNALVCVSREDGGYGRLGCIKRIWNILFFVKVGSAVSGWW